MRTRNSLRQRAGPLAACAIAVLAAASPAVAALPQQEGAVTLPPDENLRLEGAGASTAAGSWLASAGDVNGDGVDDVLVGGSSDSGINWLVFGGDHDAPIVVNADLGSRGFQLDTEVVLTGAAAGDVNGDGLGDLILGNAGAVSGAGRAWVVFGKAGSAPVNLESLDTSGGGFMITGAAAGDAAGTSVAGVGNVDGEPGDDVVVGAPGSDSGGTDSGSAYVVSGRTDSSPVDLSALGEDGFEIVGADGDGGSDCIDVVTASRAGTAVAGADVDGDGVRDVLVGAPGEVQGAGAVYGLFGGGLSGPIDLGEPLGDGGFVHPGQDDGNCSGTPPVVTGGTQLGSSLGGLGDFDGDGDADLVAGNAPGAEILHGPFGDSAAIVGSRIDNGGGVAVPAGDVNGDGLGDVATVFSVIFGRAGNDAIDAEAPGDDGYTTAVPDQAWFGPSIRAGGGDFNGDGRDDVLVGDPSSPIIDPENPNPFETHGFQGAVYLLYGFGDPQLSYGDLNANCGQPVGAHAPNVERTGPATFAAGDPLPAGLSLDTSTGAISGTPPAAQPRREYEITMTDATGDSVSEQLAIQVGACPSAPPDLPVTAPFLAPPPPPPPPMPVPGPPAPPPGASLARGSTFRVSAGGVVQLTVACRASVACAGTVDLATARAVSAAQRRRKRVLRLGRAAFRVQPGKSRRVRVRLSRSGRRLLARTRRQRAKLTVTTRRSPSSVKTVRTVTLKLARKRR